MAWRRFTVRSPTHPHPGFHYGRSTPHRIPEKPLECEIRCIAYPEVDVRCGTHATRIHHELLWTRQFGISLHFFLSQYEIAPFATWPLPVLERMKCLSGRREARRNVIDRVECLGRL